MPPTRRASEGTLIAV